MYQSVFKRYELKYMITLEQKVRLLEAMEPFMKIDQYGRDTIRNIYFDTDNYRLIRHSIEKPAYKEKLRIRSYRQVGPDGLVYVELKKKYNSVVYKRRISLPEKHAMVWIITRENKAYDSQISKEIDYFLEYYETIQPRVFLSYEREAYYALDGSDFRVTFDENILCRQDRLSLEEDVGGDSILEDGKCLMEIKCSSGIPLWLTEVLTKEKIYKTSFSKYGTYYMNYILPRLIKEKKDGDII